MNLDSMQEIVAAVRREGKPFWEIILETDMANRGVSRGNSLEKMSRTWHTMKEASEVYTGDRRSLSGLSGGQGKQMREYAASSAPIGGEFIAQVIAEALSMGESNACMRRIVAAPTAGACGVMPAVLVPLYWRENLSEDKMLEAMFTASGIGAVIAYRACISGAGGDRQRLRHGGRGPGPSEGGQGGADLPCGGYGAEKSAGPGLRPGGRSGGGALRQAQRHRRHERRRRRGHGPGGH